MSTVNTVYDVWGRKIHGGVDDTRVRAPNMYERAREEYDAVRSHLHGRRSSIDGRDGYDNQLVFRSERSEDEWKKPNIIKKAKDEIKSLFGQKDKTHRHHHHHHHHHSHGRSDDDFNEVRAPNVFVRGREELDAVMDNIHHRNEERDGFECSLGKLLEKICSPWADNRKYERDSYY